MTCKIQTNQVILGQASDDLDGSQVGGFGEMPQLTLARVSWVDCAIARVSCQQRYDAAWDMPPLCACYVLNVRHNSAYATRVVLIDSAALTGD